MDTFFLEQRLQEGNPDLHQRLSDSIVVLRTMLKKFLIRFPDFTDHSILHSMDVAEFCNQMIGYEQVQKLLPEECYVLLMACYLHDTGMGITDMDLKAFAAELDLEEYLQTHGEKDIANVVRKTHNELSGLIITKYADLFDIPSQELTRAIVQVARGHRKTDLFSDEFADIPFEGGMIRTAYLAAVLMLADEVDVGVGRNPELFFDTSHLTEEPDIRAFGTHESIREVDIEGDTVVLYSRPISPVYEKYVEEVAGIIQETIDYCCEVARTRSDLKILQTQVVIRPVEERE